MQLTSLFALLWFNYFVLGKDGPVTRGQPLLQEPSFGAAPSPYSKFSFFVMFKFQTLVTNKPKCDFVHYCQQVLPFYYTSIQVETMDCQNTQAYWSFQIWLLLFLLVCIVNFRVLESDKNINSMSYRQTLAQIKIISMLDYVVLLQKIYTFHCNILCLSYSDV